MLVRNAEIVRVDPRARGAGYSTQVADLRIREGQVAEIAANLDPGPNEPVLDANGAALLPGLHDHHIHLFALAAAKNSIPCGPPTVTSYEELARAMMNAPRDRPVRGTGYHESVAGVLGRDQLDCLVADRPLKIQHRSGAMWMLNSAALAALPCDDPGAREGMERDENGRPTGRLFRLDAWIRSCSANDDTFPSLEATAKALLGAGITGVTDATPTNAQAELAAFERAAQRNEFPLDILVMGGMELERGPGDPDAPTNTKGSSRTPRAAIRPGALKVILDEARLPALDTLIQTICDAHGSDRPVAIHCVTRTELVFALAGFDEAGLLAGDRLEHASIAPDDLADEIAKRELIVVTQPGFVHERGDAYLKEVETSDQPWLYRCRGFLERGIPLAAGTDAPFGQPDPWLAMRAAMNRRTRSGNVLGRSETLSPEEALTLFLSAADQPGGAPRRIDPGVPADLCLLDRPWKRARAEMSKDLVRATLKRGHLVFSRQEWGQVPFQGNGT